MGAPIASNATSTPAPPGRPAVSSTHGGDEIADLVVDRRCAEAFDHGQVLGRAGADRFET